MHEAWFGVIRASIVRCLPIVPECNIPFSPVPANNLEETIIISFPEDLCLTCTNALRTNGVIIKQLQDGPAFLVVQPLNVCRERWVHKDGTQARLGVDPHNRLADRWVLCQSFLMSSIGILRVETPECVAGTVHRNQR